MNIIIGLVLTIGCILGGFIAMGGHMEVLNQPFELVIIGGAGLGGYIMANSMKVLKDTGKALGEAFTPQGSEGAQLSRHARRSLLPDARPAHEVAQRDRKPHRQPGRILDLPVGADGAARTRN